MIEALYEEARQLATERHAEVITKAFRMASIHCPHCQFPQNAGDFYYDLAHYTELRKKLHRLEKAHRYTTYGDGLGSYYDGPCGWGKARVSFATEMSKLEREAKLYRDDLAENWPCKECWEKYNPTGRKNYTAYRDHPVEKDLLE